MSPVIYKPLCSSGAASVTRLGCRRRSLPAPSNAASFRRRRFHGYDKPATISCFIENGRPRGINKWLSDLAGTLTGNALWDQRPIIACHATTTTRQPYRTFIWTQRVRWRRCGLLLNTWNADVAEAGNRCTTDSSVPATLLLGHKDNLIDNALLAL